MTPVTAQDVVYSDQYFKFGQCLTGMVFSLPVSHLNIIALPIPQHKKPIHQTGYMPIFNSLRLKYGMYPGMLIFENQNQTTNIKRLGDVQQWHQMLPIIECIFSNDTVEGKDVMVGSKKNVSLDYEFSTAENQVTNIVHRDTRNVLSRISLTEKMALQELDRKYSVTEMPSTNVESFIKKDVLKLVRDEEETPLLPLLPVSYSKTGHEFERMGEFRRVHEESEDHRNSLDSERASVSKSSSSYNVHFSLSKAKSKRGFKTLDISDYEMLPESDGCENVHSCDPFETKGNELSKSFMNQKTLTVPSENVSKYGHAPSSSSINIQESSFSSIEPYPLPEAPSLLLLEPLLLMQQDTTDGRTPVSKKRERRKEQLTHSEQQKVARIMIGYTLAFFLLAIVTFYVVYFV
jgi:hypothetical protein